MTQLVKTAANKLVQEIYEAVKCEIYSAETGGTITPEEAVNLSGRMSIEEIAYAGKIYDALRNRYDNDWAIGMMFEAGRIAGVRQERLKNKQHNELTEWVGGIIVA